MTSQTRRKPTPRTPASQRAPATDKTRTQNISLSLAPPDYVDPVVEAYKKDVDRTLLRENLKLTVDARFRKLESVSRFAMELREAGLRARSKR